MLPYIFEKKFFELIAKNPVKSFFKTSICYFSYFDRFKRSPK